MWLNVVLRADAAHAEALSEALLAQGAISVSIEDALAGTPAEMPQFAEPGDWPGDDRGNGPPLWPESKVIALFAPDDGLEQKIAAAIAAAGLERATDCSLEEVEERDWVRASQSQFAPLQISDTLWIVPSWCAPPDPAATNLVLDPGIAFGTGSHPTTRLCLSWLCRQPLAGRSLLDYGCGSGILAIAAAKLGAAPVVGVDIDPDALAASRDNARANGVSIELRHSSKPLADTFDFIVANILAQPLISLAPLFARHLGPGGVIAMSGVLESQAEEVIAACAPHFPLAVAASDDGWVLLRGAGAAGPPAPDSA